MQDSIKTDDLLNSDKEALLSFSLGLAQSLLAWMCVLLAWIGDKFYSNSANGIFETFFSFLTALFLVYCLFSPLFTIFYVYKRRHCHGFLLSWAVISFIIFPIVSILARLYLFGGIDGHLSSAIGYVYEYLLFSVWFSFPITLAAIGFCARKSRKRNFALAGILFSVASIPVSAWLLALLLWARTGGF